MFSRSRQEMIIGCLQQMATNKILWNGHKNGLIQGRTEAIVMTIPIPWS